MWVELQSYGYLSMPVNALQLTSAGEAIETMKGGDDIRYILGGKHRPPGNGKEKDIRTSEISVDSLF